MHVAARLGPSSATPASAAPRRSSAASATHARSNERFIAALLCLFVTSWFVVASGVLELAGPRAGGGLHAHHSDLPSAARLALLGRAGRGPPPKQSEASARRDHDEAPGSSAGSAVGEPFASAGDDDRTIADSDEGAVDGATTTTNDDEEEDEDVDILANDHDVEMRGDSRDAAAGAASASKRYPLRMYCAVPAVYNRASVVRKWKGILSTWGWRCNVLKFFIHPYNRTGALSTPHPDHIVDERTGARAEIVMLKDFVRTGKHDQCWTMMRNDDGSKIYTPCKHIWEKVWRMWVYVAAEQRRNRTADYFFKIDDDTYFIPETMRQVLREKRWDPDRERHYFGYRGYPTDRDSPIVAGACVGWTYATLQGIAPVYERMEHEYGDRSKFKHGRCVDRDGATEEITTSRCLRDLGVHAEDLRDEKNRMRVLPWMAKDILTYKRKKTTSSWFYKDQEWTIPTEENCCSDRPVAIHYMKTEDEMARLHDLLYDPLGKRELETTVSVAVPQWLAPGFSGSAQVIHSGDPRAIALEAQYFLRVKQSLSPQAKPEDFR